MEPGRTVRDLSVGEKASLTHQVEELHLALFAAATGDLNPIHFDADYAGRTPFKGRIAHGLLSAGFVSAVIGNRLPGLGTVYVAQDYRFLAPVRLGDRITAEVEILALDEERNRVRLRTTCTNQDGTVVLDGEALVMPPRVPVAGAEAEAIGARVLGVKDGIERAVGAVRKALEGSGTRGVGQGGGGESEGFPHRGPR